MPESASLPATLDDLLRRLDRLERQNRRLKLAGAAVALLATVGLLMGAQATFPERIDGREIVLRDDHGVKRLMIQMTQGKPQIVIVDSDGTPRMQLGGELLAFHDRGTTQATLGTIGGTPILGIHDAQGKRRVSLGAENDRFGLTLMNAKGTSKGAFTTDRDGTLHSNGL
jgi:hypothetical protein